MNTGKVLVLVLMSLLLAVPGTASAFVNGDVNAEVSYTAWVDYVWRGINASDVVGGARGKGAHDVFGSAAVGTEMGQLGVSGNAVFFNSYEGTDSSLAFTNVNVFLVNQIEGVPGTWTIGYGTHRWNNYLTSVNPSSQELYASVDLDAIATVTPKVTYIWDYQNADNGQLLIAKMSRAFDMAQTAPEMTGITVTPAVQVVVDHRYYGAYMANTFGSDEFKRTTKIAYFDYAVGVGYDLTEAAGVTSGKLSLNGNVGFIDHVGLRALEHGKWYGNLGVSYAF